MATATKTLTMTTGLRSPWPLAIHSSRRYLVTAAGSPFPVFGDSPWSLEVQLTQGQADSYLADRLARGFTAVLFSTHEHRFSSQSPAWKNASGSVPFADNSDWTTAVAAYWSQVDYCVSKAAALGLAVFLFPGYIGYPGTAEGWSAEIAAHTAGRLQSYGAFLGTRYAQGNVVWVMGGDDGQTAVQRQFAWNIVAGLRSVRPGAIVTGHPTRGQDAYSIWGAMAGYDFNTIYTGLSAGDESALAAVAYAKPGPLPFVSIEGRYEGEGGGDAATLRRQAYSPFLCGGCGSFFGNNPLWSFGDPNGDSGIGPAASLSSLGSAGAVQQSYAFAFWRSVPWWKLVPRQDASLVTTALGSGAGRVLPAASADGSAAVIWIPSAQSVTVGMAALSPASVRARWFDPGTGTYANVNGTPFPNAGNHSFAAPGERLLVLDGG